MGIIYKVLNIINNKSYVGQTRKTLDQRRIGHKTHVNRYKHHFYLAIRKYSWENFKWSVLEQDVPIKDLNDREIYWIQKLDTFKNGYNSTSGGGQSVVLSEEVKKKISSSLKGHQHSNKSKKKMSVSHTGKKYSQKRIDKVSQDWKITTPAGKVITIRNLRKFCRENNLLPSKMSEVAASKSSHHKNYRCEKINI